MKKPLILVGFAVVALFFYLFIQANRKNVYQVSRGDLRSFLSASGRLDAGKKAEFSFKTTGKVASVGVEEGQEVKKGDALASLDTTELGLSLARKEDDLRQAEAERAKVYDDVKGHANDETYAQRQTRTQAEVKYDKAVRDMESARKALKDASLYAPFDSLIIAKNLEVNQWVSAFTLEPQIVLVDPTTIFFLAEIDEENIQDVKVGQKAVVSFDAYPDKFTGEVYYIAGSITQTEGGDIVEIRIKIENFSERPIIGINGDVEIVFEEKKDVLIIPKDAVYKRNGDSFVSTFSGEKKVKLGIFDGTNWEVLEGLIDGERIKW